MEEVKKAPQKKNSFLSFIFDIVEVCVVAAVVSLLILFFVAKTGNVVGASMHPTMKNGDGYILSGLFYTPSQGDIIVFEKPDNVTSEGNFWVKRVIATENQTVEIKDGRVYVDGELLKEEYLPEGTVTLPHIDSASGEKKIKWTVPEGHIFVMGDNRGNSMDGRNIGPVDVNKVVGRVLFRFYPYDKIGLVK